MKTRPVTRLVAALVAGPAERAYREDVTESVVQPPLVPRRHVPSREPAARPAAREQRPDVDDLPPQCRRLVLPALHRRPRRGPADLRGSERRCGARCSRGGRSTAAVRPRWVGKLTAPEVPSAHPCPPCPHRTVYPRPCRRRRRGRGRCGSPAAGTRRRRPRSRCPPKRASLPPLPGTARRFYVCSDLLIRLAPPLRAPAQMDTARAHVGWS